jgi:hypothetical protein
MLCRFMPLVQKKVNDFPNVQVSDTTDGDSSTTVKYIKKLLSVQELFYNSVYLYLAVTWILAILNCVFASVLIFHEGM